MSNRIKIVQSAAPDERFTSTSFDGVVGQRTPLKVGREWIDQEAVIVATEVAADGRSVEFTLELPKDGTPDICAGH